jgi:class 3 adenylate cyclase
MRANPRHYSMIVVDVVGFSQRDDRFQSIIRKALRNILQEAFDEARVPPEHVVTEDRGDGKLMLVSADVSAYQLIDPLVSQLIVGLRHHNLASSTQVQIRLRMALHQGMVQRDVDGWVGSDLNTAFRLADCASLRTAVQDFPEMPLVLIVSDSIYQGIVRHGHGAIEPSNYHQVAVENKETATIGWIYASERSSSGWMASEPPTRHAPSVGGGMFTGGTVIAGGDVVGRDKIIGEF